MNLREMREEKGLTMADVGYAVGVTKQTISLWECGSNSLPMNRVEQLAQLYGHEPMEIVQAALNSRSEKKRKRCPIVNELVHARNAAKLTREEAAAKLGITPNTLYAWERNPMKLTLDKVICCAKVYGMNPMYLVEDMLNDD